MKSFLLKGHQRPLTFIKFNRYGNLLFSCSKDSIITLWDSQTGKRMGSYQGHKGAVNQCDVTYDSQYLVSASSDSSIRIWEVKTGVQICKIQYRNPCRATSLSLGNDLVAATTDALMGEPSSIHIIRFSRTATNRNAHEIRLIGVDPFRITRVFFHDVDRQLITAHEDGSVRRWDVESGKNLQTKYLHTDSINDLKFSEDGASFITASSDEKSKLIDSDSFQVIKTYQPEKPLNSVDISPIYEHILLGGGQVYIIFFLNSDKMNVHTS
eukprot:gnl/TRDRNA2_/TRDRNA2_153709_c1_seq1.p1 gnl/TRDRNA2_/TRDRNA2_153709_c1~~gnl/TRDRNA2_/TRDRNA2_153709_c1_seq1.p1  ORF type:complete len:268 (-),score=-24.28 gnl/TRDRNA2_/TRDRNA2_153709_c1_seq1:43-846(-)